MPCVYLPTGIPDGGEPFALPPGAAHHLRDVLRVREGERIRLLDGHGGACDADVASLSRHDVLVRPAGTRLSLPPPPVRVTLFQCIAKPARMDWLLEKAAELGAAAIVPILSARTVARLREREAPERWQRILESALCQCGSGWMPRIGSALTWTDARAAIRAFPGPLFVGALTGQTVPLARALAAHADALAPGRDVGVLIGPEGDFTPEELADATSLPQAVPVSLGNRVLRVETAAIYALANLLCAAEP